MANFPEPASPNFDAIRQIETNDPVLGGAAEIAGVVNSPVNYSLRALVARTQWLRQRVEGISTPAASRSQAGLARLASLAQVTAGQDDETIVTPYLLQQKINNIDIPTPESVPNASETRAGIVERLNQAEARLATDTTRYPSIANVLDALRNGTPFRASDSQYGVVKKATNAQVSAATDDEAYVTIADVKSFFFNAGIANYTLTKSGGLPTVFTQRFRRIGNVFFGHIHLTSTTGSNQEAISFSNTTAFGILGVQTLRGKNSQSSDFQQFYDGNQQNSGSVYLVNGVITVGSDCRVARVFLYGKTTN